VTEPLLVLGIPVDFILFGLTLLGVALFHHHTLPLALTGLAVITGYKLVFTEFKFGTGLAGFGQHLQHEWVILSNLFLLLMGFALLSRHFEKSRIPDETEARHRSAAKAVAPVLASGCYFQKRQQAASRAACPG